MIGQVYVCTYVYYFIQDYLHSESVAGPITTETRTLAISALTTLTYPLTLYLKLLCIHRGQRIYYIYMYMYMYMYIYLYMCTILSVGMYLQNTHSSLTHQPSAQYCLSYMHVCIYIAVKCVYLDSSTVS